MLDFNTQRRSTALKCLSHDWIKNVGASIARDRKKTTSISSENSDSKYSNSSSSSSEKLHSASSQERFVKDEKTYSGDDLENQKNSPKSKENSKQKIRINHFH